MVRTLLPRRGSQCRRWTALAAVVGLLAGACSSAAGESASPVGTGAAAVAGVAATAATAESDETIANPNGGEPGCGTTVTTVEFDPANFVDPTLDTNPFHPLKPGTQWVRGGSTLVGGREVPHQVISTMTDVIREIDGVATIAMLDESTDAGEVAQIGMDYFGLDKDGNVWLLGGYTEEYEGGEYTNTEDAWLGTADGSKIGILAPADVTMATPKWCIGGSPEDDPTVGAAVEIGVSECVEFGCYDDVRIVQEGEIGAPDNEHKYYARGVGVVRNVPLNASLHKDRFELQNFVVLSPEGLAEVSQTVLDLEEHGRATAAEVYGDVPTSQRAN